MYHKNISIHIHQQILPDNEQTYHSLYEKLLMFRRQDDSDCVATNSYYLVSEKWIKTNNRKLHLNVS
jgi:hypothetical protein